MHFTYDPRATGDDGDLRQGDVLTRTRELEAVLAEFHKHYADNDANRFFIVLTQSCDLVRRRGHDPCKARYISIAPVRPLSNVISAFMEREVEDDIRSEIPIYSDNTGSRLQQFLSRLFNNNESDYFFLNAEPAAAFPEDHCAFLRLPIALRAKEQYDVCARARLLHLNETFQAKLGWLVGQLFSRVGTRDWEAEQLSSKIDDAIGTRAIFLDKRRLNQLKRRMSESAGSNPESVLSQAEIESAIKSLKTRKQEVIERIGQLLREDKILTALKGQGQLTDEQLTKLIRTLDGDSIITSLLK